MVNKVLLVACFFEFISISASRRTKLKTYFWGRGPDTVSLCMNIVSKKYPLKHIRCFCGVVVSVLATGPKGCRFKTLLRAIKIHSTPSFRWEVKL
jgi:hypothetical protein